MKMSFKSHSRTSRSWGCTSGASRIGCTTWASEKAVSLSLRCL